MGQNAENVSPMSNAGRNTYVVERLTAALLELLEEELLAEIPVSRLCRRAGVGRASFYRNFESKEDILRAHIGKLFRDWTDEYEQREDAPLSALVEALFGHFTAHRAFYQLLNERELTYLLKDVILGLCGPKPEHTAIEAYAGAFAAYSLYGWIETWFQRGMRESPAFLAELFRSQGL